MEREFDIIDRKNIKVNKELKSKIPITVFACIETQTEKNKDYKKVFTEIISNRIQELNL